MILPLPPESGDLEYDVLHRLLYGCSVKEEKKKGEMMGDESLMINSCRRERRQLASGIVHCALTGSRGGGRYLVVEGRKEKSGKV